MGMGGNMRALGKVLICLYVCHGGAIAVDHSDRRVTLVTADLERVKQQIPELHSKLTEDFRKRLADEAITPALLTLDSDRFVSEVRARLPRRLPNRSTVPPTEILLLLREWI